MFIWVSIKKVVRVKLKSFTQEVKPKNGPLQSVTPQIPVLSKTGFPQFRSLALPRTLECFKGGEKLIFSMYLCGKCLSRSYHGSVPLLSGLASRCARSSCDTACAALLGFVTLSSPAHPCTTPAPYAWFAKTNDASHLAGQARRGHERIHQLQDSSQDI